MSNVSADTRAQDLLCVLLGVGGLVLKSQYSGPAEKRVTASSHLPRASAAALAFMVVQLFEVLDGFGIMTNVYDRLDLAANTAGIALAITLDVIVTRMGGCGRR